MKAVCVFVLFLFSLFFPFFPASADTAPSQLDYTIEAVPKGATLCLSVGLSFLGDGTGHTRLHLPSHFSGQQDLDKNVRNLSVLSPSTTLADTDAPDVKLVTFPPGQPVHLHYEIMPDEPSHASRAGAYFRPALARTFFHVIGTTVWAYPSQYNDQLSVALHWHLPAGWTFCDSLGTGQTEQRFSGTLTQFQETIYVGGDFRILTVQAGGKPVTVALRGKWKFSDAEFAALTGRIVTAEREFWRDNDFPYYLVTLAPVSPSEVETGDGGVELTHSVALFQPEKRALDFGLKYVLAHELFHTWNADKMSAADAPLYWFSEGFTDYYARVLLLRAGLISLDDYARDFNRIVREYAQSPSRRCRGEEADRAFYSGTSLARLPYQQGALLAAHWNAAIRRAAPGGRCLDDVLRDLRSADAPVSAASIAAALARSGVPEAADEIKRVVTDGGDLAADPDVLGPGFTLRTVRVAPFDLGFDGPATVAQRTVVGVRPGSHAFWAGLRDGQEVAFCAPFVLGDPGQRLSLTVHDSSGTKDVEFTPAGDGLPTPQYARNKSAASDQACLAWMGNLSPPTGR